MVFEIISVVAVVSVGLLYLAYRKPEWFGIASKEVGEGIDEGAAWAKKVVDKAKGDK